MIKILLVDDVPGWVRFHETNIKYLNLDTEIDKAYSAEEALSKLELNIDSPYDAIFTDLQMENKFLPKLAGEWLIEQIKMFKEYNNTKITIISAAPNISQIAKKHHTNYISKTVIRNAEPNIYQDAII